MWILLSISLTACSLDDLVCEEEVEASTKRCYKSSQNLSSFYSSLPPLPTIQEKLPVDETGVVLCNSSDANHNSQIAVENGGRCQSSMDFQEVKCRPNVQRSASYGFRKVRPKMNNYGVKLSLTPSPPEAPMTCDMIEMLLPAINVDQYNDKVQQR